MKHKPSFDNAFYRVFEKEIAAQLGFTEVTAFINFFKRYEAITSARFCKKGR